MNPIEVNFTIDPMNFPLWIGAYLVIGVAVCALILWQELFVRITKERRQSIMRGKGAKARHVKSSLHAVVAWLYRITSAILPKALGCVVECLHEHGQSERICP